MLVVAGHLTELGAAQLRRVHLYIMHNQWVHPPETPRRQHIQTQIKAIDNQITTINSQISHLNMTGKLANAIHPSFEPIPMQVARLNRNLMQLHDHRDALRACL